MSCRSCSTCRNFPKGRPPWPLHPASPNSMNACRHGRASATPCRRRRRRDSPPRVPAEAVLPVIRQSGPALDAVFAALADPTRRGILAALASGTRPVSDLARPFRMSLPGVLKHVRILERAGLLERRKTGRVVSCTLSAAPLREAVTWLETYRNFWNQQLDALASYLDEANDQEKHPWPTRPKSPSSRSPGSSARRPPRSGRRSPTRR